MKYRPLPCAVNSFLQADVCSRAKVIRLSLLNGPNEKFIKGSEYPDPRGKCMNILECPFI